MDAPIDIELHEGESRLAMATLFWPERCSYWVFGILHKAILSGLRRHGIDVTRHGAFYRELFATNVICIATPQKNACITALKETLAELGLLEQSAIAFYSPEDCWVTIHGIGLGGIHFADAFLRKEDIAASRQEIKKLNTHSDLMWAAFLKQWKSAHSNETDSTK